jgi:hypothetical protein
MKYSIRLFLAAVGLVVFACVEPYDLNFGSQKEILFIEADINDYDSLQYVIIKKNIPEPNNIIYRNIENAKVQLIEGTSKLYDCAYTTEGKYQLPKGFKSKTNTPYQLRIVMEGSTYESTIETTTAISPIERIYAQFAEKGIDFNGKKIDGHRIFLDTKDSETKGQYYLWQYKLYEKQDFCASCSGGRYFTTPAPLGRCVDDANLARRGVVYDYLCVSNCWDIIYSKDLNVMTDNFTNGQTIKGRLVANVPYYQYRNSLIDIQQYSISKSAFDYFNLMVNQTQRNGTLADTPPAGLIGNVKNTSNKSEAVGGLFMVSSKTSKTFVIQRKESFFSVSAIGLFNGRQPTLEPLGNDTSRPPFAPCIESETRTKIRPIGWVD